MQTFLPSSSFTKSAKMLDNKRLGKQRVEAYQILQVLLGKKSSWKNHPAVKMWIGHEGALFAYMCAMCNTWVARGFRNTLMQRHIKRLSSRYGDTLFADTYTRPQWLGNRRFHASHRSNLLRKDKKFYKQYKWKEKSNLPYIWPVVSQKPCVA